METLWLWAQQVSLVPWLLLLAGGPVLSWLACRVDRRRLRVLVLAWSAFGITLVAAYGDAAQQSLRALWRLLPV